MNCRDVQSRLTALMDGELPEATAARIQAHLDTCATCAPIWQEHLALRQLTAAWTVEGGEVWEAIRQEIEPDTLGEILSEMQRMRSEIKALRTEVAALRAQVAARPVEEARGPSPLLPYAPAARSTSVLM